MIVFQTDNRNIIVGYAMSRTNRVAVDNRLEKKYHQGLSGYTFATVQPGTRVVTWGGTIPAATEKRESGYSHTIYSNVYDTVKLVLSNQSL